MIRILVSGMLLSATLIGVSGCTVNNKKLARTDAALENLSEVTSSGIELNTKMMDVLAGLEARQSEVEVELGELKQTVSRLERQGKVISAQLSKKESNVAPAKIVKEERTLDKLVLGRVEWMWLPGSERYFAAQLDTALELSLVYADDITKFERNGERWLRFSIMRNDWPAELEVKVLRIEKQSYLGSQSTLKGSVVALPIEIAGFKDEVEFLIVARKKEYPQVVLGKNFLTDIALVDVSQKYTSKQSSARVASESKLEKQFLEAKAELEAKSTPLVNDPVN